MFEERLITERDYNQYIENVPGNKVELIWVSIVNQLSTEELQKEAKSKGFALVPHPDLKEDGIAKNFTMTIPNGSKQLVKEINSHHNLISLIKD